jgi:hypothetical protein
MKVGLLKIYEMKYDEFLMIIQVRLKHLSDIEYQIKVLMNLMIRFEIRLRRWLV